MCEETNKIFPEASRSEKLVDNEKAIKQSRETEKSYQTD
jgi:hypothetical protein